MKQPLINLDRNFWIYIIVLFALTYFIQTIAILNGQWTFYLGDAYYLRAESEARNHPANQLATVRAVDNKIRSNP